jgi:flavin reductase (DIM6/NTAB) family NADH-FMN oxidoreductase RutF
LCDVRHTAPHRAGFDGVGGRGAKPGPVQLLQHGVGQSAGDDGLPRADPRWGKEDTLANIEATGEFVVATVTADLAEPMNRASAPYPPDVDEFVKAGLTALPAHRVQAARVAESPVNCECVLERIIDYGDQPGAGAVVLGKIVAIHVDDALLAPDGLLDDAKLRTIGRLGRGSYTHTSDRFDLPRPAMD